MYDTSQENLESARSAINAHNAGLVKAGVLQERQAREDEDRLTQTRDATLVGATAQLLSESAPEDLKIKLRVFETFSAVCGPDVVFTTNTSDLLPSMLAEATGRPDRFAAFHFHAPMLGAHLVDIMPHPGTSAETVSLLQGVAARLGQETTLLTREHPGYVFNTLLNAWNRAALELAANGVATPEDVDKAWKTVMRAPIGPFGVLDRVGLDTALRITQLGAEAYQDPGLRVIATYLNGYVAKGLLGVKSGQGFYEYA
jgi:3-hydroxybutyryl-CoA dehydrogenase